MPSADLSLSDRHDASAGDLADASAADPRDASLLEPCDAYAASVADAGPTQWDPGDASAAAAGDGCGWCGLPLLEATRRDARYCSRKCRQSAFRVRRRLVLDQHNGQPLRFAYADPPYPGKAWMYRDQASYAGEVDHRALVASLETSYDGFALSTSAAALVAVLPLFTRPFHVCPWVKPIGVSSLTFGLHNAWEPLIVVPGRELRPGVRDWCLAQPARGGGSSLIGRKPESFCTFLFAALGMLPGDSLADLFPGSGIVSRAWTALCRDLVSATAARDNSSGRSAGV